MSLFRDVDCDSQKPHGIRVGVTQPVSVKIPHWKMGFFSSTLLCSFIKLTTIKKYLDLFGSVGSYLWCLRSLIFVMACEI